MRPHTSALRQLGVLVGVIVVTCLTLASVVGYYRKQPSVPATPELVEGSKNVLLRVYADSPSIDYHVLVSEDGYLCVVTEQAWLQAVVGEAASCAWKPVNSTDLLR